MTRVDSRFYRVDSSKFAASDDYDTTTGEIHRLTALLARLFSYLCSNHIYAVNVSSLNPQL